MADGNSRVTHANGGAYACCGTQIDLDWCRWGHAVCQEKLVIGPRRATLLAGLLYAIYPQSLATRARPMRVSVTLHLETETGVRYASTNIDKLCLPVTMHGVMNWIGFTNLRQLAGNTSVSVSGSIIRRLHNVAVGLTDLKV